MPRVPVRSTEDELLVWLRRSGHVPRIGDDAALLPPLGRFAVTIDSQIAEVHFPANLDVAVLARRLLAVNLSDLAAVGAEPRYAFLALSVPPSFDHRRFFRAFLAAAKRARLELAGGDLVTTDRATLTLTLLGERPHGGRWLERSIARAGDTLWVGGTLGESALGQTLVARGARLVGRTVEWPARLKKAIGEALLSNARRAVLRHLAPQPQLELGQALGRQPRAAAIDLSDGLARDLRRLARESGIGARIDATALPLASKFRELAQRLELDPLALSLGGGEDYILLFSLPRGSAPEPRFRAYPIGKITRSKELLLEIEGQQKPLPDLGWDHLSPRQPKPLPKRKMPTP